MKEDIEIRPQYNNTNTYKENVILIYLIVVAAEEIPQKTTHPITTLITATPIVPNRFADVRSSFALVLFVTALTNW